MPTTQRRSRAPVDAGETSESDAPYPTGAASASHEKQMAGVAQDEKAYMVKKLVRYALACEFSRTPIRRDRIRDTVLGNHTRAFKKVFSRAQIHLRSVFGMEMVELPARDKDLMTVEQKRKAARSQSQKEATSNAYMLVNILPNQYRTARLLPPSKYRSEVGEASFIGLYTFIISLIMLNGGQIRDVQLRRHLTRLNANENMPGANPRDRNAPNEKTEDVLFRMTKLSYLVKVKEQAGNDEESTTWHVGPRGKKEVNEEAIAAFVREVYREPSDELEEQLQTSLKTQPQEADAQEDGQQVDEDVSLMPEGNAGRSSRRRSGMTNVQEYADEDYD